MEPTPDRKPKQERPAEETQVDGDKQADDAKQAEDEDQQEQWRKAYILQQRRRNCPGCGDDGEVF